MAAVGLQSARIATLAASSPYGQAIGLFILAAALLCLKSPDALLTPQFWAEDGPVFFAAQFGQDWPQLLTPYAGYLHTVTRLVAWIASRFDLAHTPLIYNALAILIDAACIAYVSLRLAPWFARWALFLSFFIVPSSGDIFGTATNVQWFMQFALAAACLAPAAGGRALPRTVRIAGHALLALAALSGPFSVLVAGLAVGARLTGMLPLPAGQAPASGPSNILRAIAPVGRRLPRTALMIVLACACIQVIVMATHEVRTPVSSFTLSPQLQASFGVAHLPSFYLYTISHSFLAPQLAFMAAMIGVATACLVYTLLRPALWNGIACLFLALGGVQPLLAYLKERNVFTFTATSHYFYLLSVVCCWIAWHLLAAHFRGQRKPAVTLVAAMLVLGALFRTDYFRREPLHDLHWARHADRIRGGGSAGTPAVLVPINPAPWHIRLSGK